jgi:hypothetical protein
LRPRGAGSRALAWTACGEAWQWSEGSATADKLEVSESPQVACVRRAAGTVRCWGDRALVGAATRPTLDAPVVVPGLAI